MGNTLVTDSRDEGRGRYNESGGRSTAAIVKDLCSIDLTAVSDEYRLPHDCYMIFVGHLSNKEHVIKLTKQAHDTERLDGNVSATDSKFIMMETEEMEYFLEYVTMDKKVNVSELIDNRERHLVYEDHFNSAVFDMVKRNASFEQLKRVCRFYEKKAKADIDKIMKEHEKRVKLSTPYFIDLGLSHDDAQAASLAISFYTGTKSEAVSRGASLVARQANGEVIEKKAKEEMSEAAVILFYLVKALSHIPYYWGYVTRACQLTDVELKLYMPGCLVTWIQFSSSKRGKEVAGGFNFAHRNTFFKIYSLTGRPIGKFSNFEKEEDEVLFLPHSTFFVFKHEVGFHGTQHTIYMRQVELGLSKWSVLWVDDRIFVENWENKAHMESAAARALNMNVHFIPKSSTENALSFLRSPFGERLKNQNTFRIVTDMNRENENPTHNAGARLIKAIRKLGFKNECLVFTGNQRKAEKILQLELNSTEKQFVAASDKTEQLRSFVNFDCSSALIQQLNVDYLEDSDDSYKSTATTNEQCQDASGGDQYEAYNVVDSKRMHNPSNTDIDILIRNCQERNLTNSHHNCVLLTTGSFNPVHPLHFQNLLRVKEYLEHEQQPPWNVLAGYISPTHDSYVHSKLGDPAWIPAKDRCRLCEGAIEYEGSQLSSWISVSRGESEWDGGFVDFGPVTENLRDFLNTTLVGQENILQHPLRVVYVCGLDHFNKCSYLESMAKQPNMACAIVFRVGYDEQQVFRSVKASSVIYISLSEERTKLVDVSSTQIRQYYQSSTSKKTNIEQNIYPVVREYMSKKYQKK
ncbi:unnamed protein product [Adineta steineri]|uniref:NAD(P)(+)--arginine ADP-ribosyltransferase n=1 Tax=Adineta steineri TaxID=433720 RepID=A0A814AJT6_9BILA|nr:unnamed protein product [Adineta steineri]CAF0912849.1 unnamed protein product [Adineta steineri]CAF3629725.1 unnamed protein product [Adineta steineri]CAF4009463.1 unnamed protein product [Adineta steineri]